MNKVPYFETKYGKIVHGDSLCVLREIEDESVDLIVTSPPFALIRKKKYDNVSADEYNKWFLPFAFEMHRVLKRNGSLVVDIGGGWNPGLPTKSLYNFRLLIMMCDEVGFHLAHDFYWWSPSKLPTPAEWVTVRRIRVKEAVNTIWWLSKTPWPKASNKRVLQPYSQGMKDLFKNGVKATKNPSGHQVSKNLRDNGASIPPNLIALAHTENNSSYLRYCRKNGLTIHPARFPSTLPEYFIRMLTDTGDLVIDPFSGSCTTGEVAELLGRRWICIEREEDYLKGAVGRFLEKDVTVRHGVNVDDDSNYYRIPKPDILWNLLKEDPLPVDGGKQKTSTLRTR